MQAKKQMTVDKSASSKLTHILCKELFVAHWIKAVHFSTVSLKALTINKQTSLASRVVIFPYSSMEGLNCSPTPGFIFMLGSHGWCVQTHDKHIFSCIFTLLFFFYIFLYIVIQWVCFCLLFSLLPISPQGFFGGSTIVVKRYFF